MELVAIYLIAGVAAGLVSGLFGLGGGLTIVPALAFALPLEGVAEKYVMHLAIGTSLVVMVVTALYTTRAPASSRRSGLGAVLAHRPPSRHRRRSRRDLRRSPAWRCPSRVLHRIRQLYHRPSVASPIRRRGELHGLREDPGAPTVPGGASLWIYGLATGICGALLGAGAAIIIVPYLRAARYRIQLASAIAAGLSAVIGVGAGAGYVAGGLNETDLPSAALGYLYLPAFAGLSGGALIGSPLGVKISHSLDEDIQFWLFLGYLTIVLGVMIMR